MSSRSPFLCFICHSNVHAETTEESREKYREIVGINLCPDSQLCHICCHVLNKLSLFRSICVKRTLEFPVPFSEKGTINLQKTDTEVHIICPEAPCIQYGHNCRSYLFTTHDEYSTSENYNDNQNQYVALEENKLNDYFNTVNINTYEDNVETEHNGRANDVINNKNEVIDDDYPITIENDSYRDDPDLLNDKIGSIAAIHNDEFATDFTEQHDDNFGSFIDDEPKYENDYDKYSDTDNIEDFNEIKLTKEVDETLIEEKEAKVKKKKKKKSPKNILLSVEEQKAELEARRKDKKYLEAEFKCYNCALPFLFKDTYQAHMMRHEESNGEYQCEICTLRFASPAMQRIHAMRHARRCGCGSRLRRCGCDTTLPPQRVACHLCGNLLKHAKGLQQHLKRVHMSKTSNRIHSCNICGESFPSQHTVRTHMIKHIKRKFPCPHCSSVCSSPYTLARHVKLHTGHRPRRTEQRRHAHLLECPVCMKICPNQRGLTLHMQAIHSNRKDHVCPHCDARYATRPSLLRHIAQHTRKPEPKKSVCHICGSSFKDRSKLNRHLRNVCEKAKLEEQLEDLYE